MRLGEFSAHVAVETVPTGCLSLDLALGLGGVPKGRVIEIYGPESSGKTNGGSPYDRGSAETWRPSAGFIDAEHAMDPVYAKNIEWISTNFTYPSRTAETRRLRLQRQW